MKLDIGVLDQSPVVSGATPRDAILATLDLARRAEALGYSRYWLAEHHGMRGLADSSPEVLLARVGAQTERIRIGTGGVLLPHYSAYKVAEQFRMLETLTPGRIDLGIGRAPGGLPLVSAALGTREVERFPEQVRDLIDHLDGSLPGEHRLASLPAMPAGSTSPQVWLLGSSGYSAILAAELGLPFAFAHFISGDAEAVTRAYRERFRPSHRASEPRVLLTIGALTANDAAEAEELARTIDLWRLRNRHGVNRTVPSFEEARDYPYTPYDIAQIAQNRHRLTLGTPAEVSARITSMAEAHRADEVMIVTIAPTYEARLRSYELLAEAFALQP